MDTLNPWDTLSQKFNTHTRVSEISPFAADNILIAWPALLRGIHEAQATGHGLSAMDFGCGAGSFCAALQDRGYKVTGCDTSQAMIKMARLSLADRGISFYKIGHNDLSAIREAPFDLISAIMVFHFIANIAGTLRQLANILRTNGVLAFAVFNRKYIMANHGDKRPFDGFAPHNPDCGHMTIGAESRIPVFLRTETEYDAMLEPLGFQRIFASEPSFTEEYINRYSDDTHDCSQPEYIILGYRKLSPDDQ